LAITGDEEGILCVTIISQEKVVHRVQAFEEGIESIAACPTFPLFAAGSLTGKITVFNLSDYTPRLSITAEHPVIKLGWFNLDLYSCHAEGLINCHDARTGELRKRLVGSETDVLDMAIGQGLVVVGTDANQIFAYTVVTEDSQPQISEPTAEAEAS
jgi:hypothetical protein